MGQPDNSDLVKLDSVMLHLITQVEHATSSILHSWGIDSSGICRGCPLILVGST